MGKRYGWKGAGAPPPDPNACTMWFENAAGEAVEIFWTSGGKQQSMGSLKVGGSTSLESFKGHGFLMKSTTGESRSSNVVECKSPKTVVSLSADFKLKVQKEQ